MTQLTKMLEDESEYLKDVVLAAEKYPGKQGYAFIDGASWARKKYIKKLQAQNKVMREALKYVAQTSGAEQMNNVDYIDEVVNERKFDITEAMEALAKCQKIQDAE